MVDLLNTPDGLTRTGHFIFQVRRRDGGAWNWRLRVEAVESGACGVFESIQDALRFMRAHLVIDADTEAHVEEGTELTANESEWLGEPLDPIETVE